MLGRGRVLRAGTELGAQQPSCSGGEQSPHAAAPWNKFGGRPIRAQATPAGVHDARGARTAGIGIDVLEDPSHLIERAQLLDQCAELRQLQAVGAPHERVACEGRCELGGRHVDAQRQMGVAQVARLDGHRQRPHLVPLEHTPDLVRHGRRRRLARWVGDDLDDSAHPRVGGRGRRWRRGRRGRSRREALGATELMELVLAVALPPCHAHPVQHVAQQAAQHEQHRNRDARVDQDGRLQLSQPQTAGIGLARRHGRQRRR